MKVDGRCSVLTALDLKYSILYTMYSKLYITKGKFMCVFRFKYFLKQKEKSIEIGKSFKNVPF